MARKNIQAVIMAGGSGTRFWPLSRAKRPKQFLPIVSRKTMIEETIERLLPLIPYSQIYTIANRAQTQVSKKLLPDVPPKNLLVEPKGKNTAPSLILATAGIYLQDPKAVVAALPADHLIKDSALFLKKLEAGAAVASKEDYLITLGIPPTYPATGYGYIQFSKKDPQKYLDEEFYSVQEFKEKPGFEQAKLFLDEGNYFWNSGMFIWRAEVFAGKLEKYAPQFFPYWQRMLQALKKKSSVQIRSIFEEIPSISIDYALMEKAKGVLMCKGDFGWSDIGSWLSLYDVWPKDKNGNAFNGESLALDSQNCLVYNPDKFTAVIGIKDIIIVETDEALLICHKEQDQRVRDAVETLKKDGKKDYL
jgi:mannose-1-phosphate guanylyltransferase